MSEELPLYHCDSVAASGFSRKVYVFVGMFQGLISEVEVFQTYADAATAFTNFCGVSHEDFVSRQAELNFKFEDSMVYEALIK